MAKEFAKPFYNSVRWIKCRDAYIRSVKGLCERCLKKGSYTSGYIVHHKIELTPDNINDPMVTLCWDNLEYLCLECHNTVHYGDGELVRDGLTFDINGNLIQL